MCVCVCVSPSSYLCGFLSFSCSVILFLCSVHVCTCARVWGWLSVSPLLDGSNVVRATYSKRLTPGKTTPADQWKMKDFDEDAPFMHMTVRVVEYQIDNDWVKTIRRNKQPKFVYNP